ncbi:MAG: hypothetical protein ACTSQY_11755, partial [Candidatus Odinarchaeia archaeon]
IYLEGNGTYSINYEKNYQEKLKEVFGRNNTFIKVRNISEQEFYINMSKVNYIEIKEDDKQVKFIIGKKVFLKELRHTGELQDIIKKVMYGFGEKIREKDAKVE